MKTPRDNVCGYWSCNRLIRHDHFLCREHYDDWEDRFIDACPSCGRFKDMEFALCLDCAYGRKTTKWKPSIALPEQKQNHKPERSKVWVKGDKDASRFYVYILKLDDGSFYVGQTRELRERMSEHKDGRAPSTAGRNPKLQYFGILPSRKSAALAEVELKKLVDSNPRHIRRLILGFHDLIREVQIE